MVYGNIPINVRSIIQNINKYFFIRITPIYFKLLLTIISIKLYPIFLIFSICFLFAKILMPFINPI